MCKCHKINKLGLLFIVKKEYKNLAAAVFVVVVVLCAICCNVHGTSVYLCFWFGTSLLSFVGFRISLFCEFFAIATETFTSTEYYTYTVRRFRKKKKQTEQVSFFSIMSFGSKTILLGTEQLYGPSIIVIFFRASSAIFLMVQFFF